MVILTKLMRFRYLGIKKSLIKGEKCVRPLKYFSIHLPKPMDVKRLKASFPILHDHLFPREVT